MKIKRCGEMARKLRFFKDQMSKAGTTWSLNIFFNQYQSSSSLYSAISSDGKFSPMSLSGGEFSPMSLSGGKFSPMSLSGGE